jgi:basic membrane lipoprotein Med (substrate-binding protein (PBP1-ABC) superfamily)
MQHGYRRIPRLVLVGSALAAVMFTAMGTGVVGTSAVASVSGAKVVSVGLLLPCATNDMTWCQQAYVAAARLRSQGLIKLRYTADAPQDDAGISRVMSQYASSGTQLIIAHSAWSTATIAVAKRFPKVNFAYAGGGPTVANVATYAEPIYQAAYIAGMAAGGITKTGVVGGVAGQNIPLCHAELAAFQAGARRIRAHIGTHSAYIGNWNDPAPSEQAVLAQADQHADVFIACGDGPAKGMIAAIKSRHLSGFAYVGNMFPLAPHNLVGSIIYNLYPYFKAMVQDEANGSFRGKTYTYGLPQGGVRLQLNPSYSMARIPASILRKMRSIQRQIAAGTFQVPYIPQ